MSTSAPKCLVFLCVSGLLLNYYAYGDGSPTKNEMETRAKNAMQAREELLTSGFTCRFFMEERNKAYDESANVEYMERGELFKIIFNFLETSEFNQPGSPTILTEVKKREYSLYKNQYMEMDWFVAQGLIGYARSVEERLIMHSMLPTQFWLNYRNRRLSHYWQPNASFFNDADLSLNLVAKSGHIILFFNPQWNFLVRKAQFFFENGVLIRELNVLQAQEIQANSQIFIPQRFSIELFVPGTDGKAHSVNKTNWELKEISLNSSLREEDFEVRFPKGAKVANNITGEAYQVGNPTRDLDLNAVRNIGKNEGNDSWLDRRTTLILLATLVLMITFAVYLFLRFKRTT